MKLEDVGTAVVKRLWVVVLIVLVAALVAAVVARVQGPVYRTEIVMAATPPKNPTTKLPDPTVGLAYAAAMSSIANACESVSVAETVSRRLRELGLEIPPEELARKASAVPIANSTSFKMIFSDSSPTRVAEIANAWGEILELKTLLPAGEVQNPYYDADFKELLMGGTLVFTNRAVPPTKPVQPKPLVYLGLGVFIGLVLGLGLAIGWEYFDPHFRSVAETEEILGLPVLGNIPRIKEASKTPASLQPGTPAWTALSDLRSNLLLSLREGGRKSLALIPVIPYEEGPRHAATLAWGVAKTGRRVLLVDADMMEGFLTRELKALDREGISEALERGENPTRAAFFLDDLGCHFIPSGKPTPRSTDLLSLPGWEEWVKEMEGEFDLVIFYAPPLLLASDATVIASWTGSSFLLIDSEHCTRKVAMEALAPLQRLEIIPSGVILANVKIKGWKRFRMPLEESPAPERVREAAAKVKGEPAPAEVASKPQITSKERDEGTGTPEGQKAAASEAPSVPGQMAWDEALSAKTMAGVSDRPPSEGFTSRSPGPEDLSDQRPKADQEELIRIRQTAVETFRRLGRSGDSIPRSWIRALRSPREEVRATAEEAISAYYQVFLEKYGIGEENVSRITATIIRMMRREGEFAHITEEEAQAHLRKLLLEAGADLRTRTYGASSPTEKEVTSIPSGGEPISRAVEERGKTGSEAGAAEGKLDTAAPEVTKALEENPRASSSTTQPAAESVSSGIIARLRRRQKG